MFLIFRHLHQTTPLSKWCFCLNSGTFPGVMEPGAALPRPPLLPKIGLLCPQYGCSALLWTLQHCHSCSCSTWLRASATAIHIQHCRETTMQEGECRITHQARIASWALEAWERPPRKTDLSLSQEESQVSWICCKRLKNGSITSDRASLYDEFPLHDSMILSNESLFILKVEHCKRHFPPWCIHHPLVRVPSSQTEPRSH